MALNPRSDLVPLEYAPTPPPFSGDPSNATERYFVEQIDSLRSIISELVDMVPQCSDTAPTNPRRGMTRYAVAPWDPLGTSFSGYVTYDGSAWAAL